MRLSFIIPCLLFTASLFSQITVTEVGELPEAVSNNPVCEGFINGVPYLFSFGGIDNSKIYSGIHTRSFRYNLETGESEVIPSLPDTRGKVGAGASRIGNRIYIMGGYYVAANGTEITSDSVHIYDIENNVFLDNGTPIPVPTDDHVQVVYRDSLIMLVTGWNTNNNIREVQIYNPDTDSWTQATPTPSPRQYRSFGASGVIQNDTIFYFGGAAAASGFDIQSYIRKGIINPQDPSQIEWSISEPDENIAVYRAAATLVDNELHWIGGSAVTYNFDGIAYNGSGGVSPTHWDLYTEDKLGWSSTGVAELPMDLRGIAEINDTLKYIAGGMLDNQEVSNKVYRLEWPLRTTSLSQVSTSVTFEIYPNPAIDILHINGSDLINSTAIITNSVGQELKVTNLTEQVSTIDISDIPLGTLTLTVYHGTNRSSVSFIKTK